MRCLGDYHYRLSEFYYKNKQFILARKEVSTSTTYWTFSWRAHALKGIILKKEGIYDAAEQEFLKALTINPNDTFSLRHLGFIYAKKGKYDNAINLYLRAMKLSTFWRDEIFQRTVPLLKKYRKDNTG